MLVFRRDSKAGIGKLYNEKEGRLQATFLTAGWGHEKVGSGLTRSRASYVIELGAYMAFSGWHYVGSRGQKIRKLVAIDEVLIIEG